MTINPRAKAILNYWFGETGANPQLWWGKNPHADHEITQQFQADYDKAIAGELDTWQENPKELLAVIILLDQFSRHIFRNTPKAFAADPIARQWTQAGIDRGYEQHYSIHEKSFLYLPFEHSESLADQEKCVALFQTLLDNAAPKDKEAAHQGLDFALGHERIIKRFGRFPHRNAILGRETTAEEAAFLQEPDSSY